MQAVALGGFFVWSDALTIHDKCEMAMHSLSESPSDETIQNAFDLLCESCEEHDSNNTLIYCCRCFCFIGSWYYTGDENEAPVALKELQTYDGRTICEDCTSTFLSEHEAVFSKFVVNGRTAHVEALQEHIENEIDWQPDDEEV